MREAYGGRVVRILHVVGANFIFICVYLHIGRGLYYNSYFKKGVWLRGVAILFLLITIAFIGYVLPWGTIRY